MTKSSAIRRYGNYQNSHDLKTSIGSSIHGFDIMAHRAKRNHTIVTFFSFGPSHCRWNNDPSRIWATQWHCNRTPFKNFDASFQLDAQRPELKTARCQKYIKQNTWLLSCIWRYASPCHQNCCQINVSQRQPCERSPSFPWCRNGHLSWCTYLVHAFHALCLHWSATGWRLSLFESACFCNAIMISQFSSVQTCEEKCHSHLFFCFLYSTLPWSTP